MRQIFKRFAAVVAVSAFSISASTVLAAPPCDLKCFQIYSACKARGDSEERCIQLMDECMASCNPNPAG